MNKVKELELQLAAAKEAQCLSQREARNLIKPIYSYKTKVQSDGGIYVVGTLENVEAFDAHLEKYGSLTDRPELSTDGITYYLTVEGIVIGSDGGWIQDPIKAFYGGISVTLEEWALVKESKYPARFSERKVSL